MSGCSLEFKWPLMFHFWNSAIITRRGESPAKTNGITSSFRSSCGSWRTMIWRVWPSSTRSSTSTRCSASRISSWLLTWWRASRYCATRRRARRCLLSAGWGGNATPRLSGWSLSQTQTSVISSIQNEVRVVNSQERCAVWECKSGLSNRGYSTQWRVYWWRSVSDYWCLSARFILTRAALAAGDDSGACSLLCWVLTLFLLFWQQDAKPLEVYSIEFMVDNNQLGFLGNVWNNLYFTKTINNNKETLMIKSFSHKAFLFSCFQCRIETRTSMFTCICLKVRAVDVL